MKYISLVVILFILASCTKEKTNKTNQLIKIDINDEINSILPKLSIKSVIPLEKNNQSLFGNIGTIEFVFNRIYMLDAFSSKSVLAFSENGTFINKTKLGKGPDEMINPFALFVDKAKKNVLVYDQTLNYIYVYDLDLNFLNKKEYKGVPILEFAKVNEDNWIVRSHYYKDYAHTLYNLNFNSIVKQYIPDIDYSGAQGLSRSVSTNNRTLLISSFDYNIYQLINNNIHSEYYFDFGKHNIEIQDVKKHGLSGIWKLTSSGERVSAPHEIAENNDFLLFHVFYKGDPIYYIYSTKQEKTYRLNDYFEKGILPKCEIRGTLENNDFYAMVEPVDMFDFQENTTHKLFDGEISIQGNPFIITFSISDLEK